VHGTDGSQYHTGVQKGSSLATWVDALYRSATIVNENDLEVTYKDMKLLRFVIPKSLMANVSINPDNAQYYMNGPSGAINISSCAPSNMPIFMTKPHFLDASPAVLSYIDGMQPDASLHDTFVDVEPITGIVMRVLRRLQVTFNVGPQLQNVIIPTLSLSLSLSQSSCHIISFLSSLY
jgi:lysosome membrane protein 2